MNIKSYSHKEKMLNLQKELLAVEKDRSYGKKGYSVDEVAKMMQTAITTVTKTNSEL